MTDITKLAQLRAELSNQATGSKDHLRKIALSLVDKLEKCRDREIRWLALSDEKSKIITDQEEALEKAQKTIAFQQGEIKALLSSMESRTVTVKLPYTPEPSSFAPWVAKAFYQFHKDTVKSCFTVFSDACAAAGIKVEVE